MQAPRPEIRILDDAEIDTVGQVLGLARLLQGNGHYFVAWIGNEPAGHAYLALKKPPVLQDVEVREVYRRRGLARLLIAAVESAAAQLGSPTLRLSVSAHDDSVQRLYRSLGFKDTGQAPVTVRGTIQIRTGPIEVNDVLLTWEKPLTAARDE